MQEFKRILNRKVIIVIVLLLIVNIVIFTITQSTHKHDNLEAEQVKYIEGYSSTIDKILKNAQRMLKISIFNDDNSFAAMNIVKTAKDYERIEDLELSFDKNEATKAVLLYEYTNPIVFFAIIYILYNLSKEKNNGMMSITYAAKSGRKKLALKRSCYIFLIAFGLVCILYIVNTILACIMYGIDDFNGPVQTIMEYSQYTYMHSKFEYIIIAMLKNALLCASIALFINMICNMFNHINISLIATGVILCSEWWLYKNITDSSNIEYLKYINLFAIFNYNNIDRQYNNMFVFNKCISASDGLLCFMLSILIISFIFSIVFYRKSTSKLPQFVKKMVEFCEKTVQKFVTVLPFSLKELWKILVINKGIVIILLCIYLFCLVWNHTLITIPERLSNMDEIYREYGGNDWQGFLKYVEEYTKERDGYLNQISDIEYKMSIGELPPRSIFEVGRLKDKALYISDVLEEFNAKIQLHNELFNTSGIHTYLISDRGYAEAIGYNSILRENFYGIMFLVAIIIITSLYFELEYESCILDICTPTKRGRNWLFIRKYIVLLIFTIVCFGVMYTIDFIKLTNNYNIMYYDAPIQSLTYMKDIKENVSITEYIIIMLTLKLIYSLLVQSLIIFISSKKNVKNRSYIFFIALMTAIIYVIISKLSITVWIATTLIAIIAYFMIIYLSYRRWRIN